MKIVYCLNSVNYIGGIERVTIVKANALAELAQNEVYVVVTDNNGRTPTAPLSDKVHLVDLDINYYQDDWKSRWHVLKGIVLKRREHKRKLTRVLNDIQPDVVVSVGQAEKYFLPSIRGNWAKVREMHYEKNYRQRLATSSKEKLSAKLSDWYDYKLMIKHYDQIVVLTEEDKEKNWKGYDNVLVIPNPISFESDAVATLGNKKVVSVGRLSPQKNYASLVRAFRKVADRHPDWTLDLFGEGPQHRQLEEQIVALGLSEKVFLRGNTTDVESELLEASCFVLSSIFEGFGIVLIEAMSMGLPVVSYACPCGPKDIISEGENGFLVPVNDEEALADRICCLIEDKALRQRMGRMAKENVKRYSIHAVLKMWMELFGKLKVCQ